MDMFFDGQYFTAVGVVIVKEAVQEGYDIRNCKFSHVVLANDADEAHEKVLDYYAYKSNGMINFSLDSIEIFDFIS